MAGESDTLFSSEESEKDALKGILSGRFIVLDGPDGSGKSTQFRRLSSFCKELGVEVEEVREPGGTAIGEEIRRVLLDPANEVMVVRTEMLLYMASRAQLLAERIEPALESGRLVLADRFVSSTMAYQGTAGGLSPEEIAQVGVITMGRTRPDLVVIFDVDAETSESRISGDRDRMERKGRAFLDRVRAGYLSQVEQDPEGHLLIQADCDEDSVFEQLLTGLRQRLA
jgi:dTMP kinase